MMGYKQHPLSAAFPSMSDADIQALADDIKENGLHSPVVIYNGFVLDGWHRVLACERAKVNVRSIEYKGKNPVAFVKSHNWHRRHMTESQKAMAQVKLTEWREPGVTSRSAPGAELPPTTKAMAEQAGVSERTIAQAKVVESKGTEELKAAVVDGEVSVKKAAAVAKKPKREQAKALKEAKEKKPKLPKKPSAAKPAGDAENRLAKLQADYDELKENRDELADELKTCLAISEGKEAKVMNALREELRICTRRKNELMANLSEAKKSATYWMGQAKKLGWKPKK